LRSEPANFPSTHFTLHTLSSAANTSTVEWTAVLHPDGTIDPTFQPDSMLPGSAAVALQNDGKVIADERKA
jgi:hypothetical protein